MDFRDRMEAAGNTVHGMYIMHNPIVAGNYKVSIQNHLGSYSSTRDGNIWSAPNFEIAIFKSNEDWVLPWRDLTPLPEWAKLFERSFSDYPQTNTVAGYVPVEKIQEIIDWLCDNSHTEVSHVA